MTQLPIKTVGLVSKPRSDEGMTVIPALVEWLRQRQIAVVLDEESAVYAGTGEGISRTKVAATSDMLVVLGGDGTLLAAARASVGRSIPLVAVNLGGLGFLTAIKTEELYVQLERVLKGDYRASRPRMLDVELMRGERSVGRYDALNDMVLTKSEIARMIDLEVEVDTHFMCVYKADGLIVATPTGSTAYSLSAGGPIMTPNAEAICITPICPHMLTNRPMIVPDRSEICVTVRGTAPTFMTIDGQVGEQLEPGDRIVCRRSKHSIQLVRPYNMYFFDVLREKLKWGGR